MLENAKKWRFGLYLLLVLCLAGCFAGPGKEGGEVPRLQPIQAQSANDLLQFTLSASTNCAEVGETVVFTLRIKNAGAKPMEFKGDPPFDIVLEPRLWPVKDQPRPIQRWSESDSYPASPPTIIKAQEELSYTWSWTADKVYADPPRSSLAGNGLIAYLTAGDIVYAEGGGIGATPDHVQLSIGVSSMYWGLGGIRCADMKRR